MELVAVLGKYYVTDFTFALHAANFLVWLQEFTFTEETTYTIAIRGATIFRRLSNGIC